MNAPCVDKTFFCLCFRFNYNNPHSLHQQQQLQRIGQTDSESQYGPVVQQQQQHQHQQLAQQVRKFQY